MINNISNNFDTPSKNSNPFLFDLFGLKVYLDDALIICLLLFLYHETVKDEGLFITLILLLLS